MRAISRFRHLMSSTVLVAARTTPNAYGEYGYGADVSYPAHLRGERTLVRDATGQQVVSSMAAYLGANVDVQVTSRVTLSTADVSSTEKALLQPPVLSVDRRFDGAGGHHVVVRLA